MTLKEARLITKINKIKNTNVISKWKELLLGDNAPKIGKTNSIDFPLLIYTLSRIYKETQNRIIPSAVLYIIPQELKDKNNKYYEQAKLFWKYQMTYSEANFISYELNDEFKSSIEVLN